MRVAGIIKDSVVNGVGIRDVLFLQGCKHHCEGCHNPHTWNPMGGKEHTIESLVKKFKNSGNNMTISGGEPILQFTEICEFMKRIKEEQGKSFWLYTGFRYEELPPHILRELSFYVDVLVDGRFEKDKKDLTLSFRGSSNQRLIDLKESLYWNEVVLWEGRR